LVLRYFLILVYNKALQADFDRNINQVYGYCASIAAIHKEADDDYKDELDLESILNEILSIAKFDCKCGDAFSEKVDEKLAKYHRSNVKSYEANAERKQKDLPFDPEFIPTNK